MASKRADDRDDNRSRFRTDRLVEEGGKWFFLTREGTVEGPFESRINAVERLDLYAKVMSAHLLTEETEVQVDTSTFLTLEG